MYTGWLEKKKKTLPRHTYISFKTGNVSQSQLHHTHCTVVIVVLLLLANLATPRGEFALKFLQRRAVSLLYSCIGAEVFLQIPSEICPGFVMETSLGPQGATEAHRGQGRSGSLDSED